MQTLREEVVNKHQLTNIFCTIKHSPEHGGQCRKCVLCELFIAPKEFDAECWGEARAGVGILQTGRWDPMTDPARFHDLYYSPHWRLRYKGRSFADFQFLYMMQEISNSAPWYKRPFLKVQELLYFAAVRAFGKIPWENEK